MKSDEAPASNDAVSEKSIECINYLASAALAASLDFETTLKNVAEIAVSSIADWCSGHLLQPDLIVCEIGMPNENGIEFIKNLRASPLRHVPAIAVTAYVRLEEVDAALATGFQHHVGKPVSSSILLSRIQALLMPKNV